VRVSLPGTLLFAWLHCGYWPTADLEQPQLFWPLSNAHTVGGPRGRLAYVGRRVATLRVHPLGREHCLADGPFATTLSRSFDIKPLCDLPSRTLVLI